MSAARRRGNKLGTESNPNPNTSQPSTINYSVAAAATSKAHNADHPQPCKRHACPGQGACRQACAQGTAPHPAPSTRNAIASLTVRKHTCTPSSPLPPPLLRLVLSSPRRPSLAAASCSPLALSHSPRPLLCWASARLGHRQSASRAPPAPSRPSPAPSS